MATSETPEVTPEAIVTETPVVETLVATPEVAPVEEVVEAPVAEPTPVVAPVVDDAIVNEMTNDDVIASFPTTTNEFGTAQVHIDENGQIEGLASADQATTASTSA